MSQVHIRIAKQGDLTVLPKDCEATVSKAGGYTCVYQKCNGRLVWVNAIKRVKHFRHFKKVFSLKSFLTGFGTTKRVALFDTLAKEHSENEILN